MKNESLESIMNALVDGDIKKIATETNRSRTSIYQVFHKLYFNYAVLSLALDIIEKRAIAQIKMVTELRQELNQHNAIHQAKKKRKAA